MTTTYHLRANELSSDFIKSLKSLYKGKKIAITVELEMDETEYLLASEANRKVILNRIKDVQENKNLTTVNLKDL